MSDEPGPGTNDPMPDPPSDDDLDSKISEIRERAISARAKYGKTDPNSMIAGDSAKGMGIGMTAAYGIIGLPLIGAGVGWLLDKTFGTGFLVAVGAIGGLAGGIAFAIKVSNQN